MADEVTRPVRGSHDGMDKSPVSPHHVGQEQAPAKGSP
jgi:hypothetical protein